MLREGRGIDEKTIRIEQQWRHQLRRWAGRRGAFESDGRDGDLVEGRELDGNGGVPGSKMASWLTDRELMTGTEGFLGAGWPAMGVLVVKVRREERTRKQ